MIDITVDRFSKYQLFHQKVDFKYRFDFYCNSSCINHSHMEEELTSYNILQTQYFSYLLSEIMGKKLVLLSEPMSKLFDSVKADYDANKRIYSDVIAMIKSERGVNATNIFNRFNTTNYYSRLIILMTTAYALMLNKSTVDDDMFYKLFSQIKKYILSENFSYGVVSTEPFRTLLENPVVNTNTSHVGTGLKFLMVSTVIGVGVVGTYYFIKKA